MNMNSPQKSPISPQLLERESRHESEKNLLRHKLNKLSSDHNILDKQHRHLQSELGHIILKESEKTCELAELRTELAYLKAETESKARDHAELERRNYELTSQLAESRLELKQMKHSWGELKAENEVLRKMAEETTSFKEKFETLTKELEAARREKEEVVTENAKLKVTKDAVIDAATTNLRGFEKRVAALEGALGNLKLTLHSSGAQKDTITQAKETLESSRPAEKLERLVETRSVSGMTPREENSASSLSCLPVVSTVPVKEQKSSFDTNAKDKGLLRCTTKPSIAAKMNSLKPSVSEKYSSASLPICISDSEDDGEAKGLKRKLDFNDAADHSKTALTAKQSQQKIAKSDNDVEVESVDSSAKQWEFEADMVDDLEKSPEICMRAICALYRQHMTVGKSKGFNEIDAFRGMVLGRYLVDGDIHGGVKKSVTKLMEFDRDGASKCRRIAMDHSSRLFEIYKNKEDPHFAPPH